MTDIMNDRKITIHIGGNPLDGNSTRKWYGVEVEEPRGMTLPNLDHYLRAHNVGGPQFGVMAADGVMTAMNVSSEGYAAGHAITALLGDPTVVRMEQDPLFEDCCGALTARWLEIYASLNKSPKPRHVGDVFEVERLLPGHPEAFRPILMHETDIERDAQEWAAGFSQVMMGHPEVWDRYTEHHPEYQELMHIMYFVANRKGAPMCKTIKNHSSENRRRYALEGLRMDAITLFDSFRRTQE